MVMPRALTTVLATALLLAQGGPAPAADPPAAIAEAQRRLADGDGRRAVTLFEGTLPGATAEAPFATRLDWAAVAIATLAAVALVTKKLEVIPVIALSALAGLALWAAGLQGAT